jgi:uncharacterized protein
MHAIRLMIAGVFDRFPSLQVVLGHMGEGIPFMLQRTTDVLASGTALGQLAKPMELSVAEYFKRNFHISISSDPPLRCALDVIGENRVGAASPGR